MLFYLGFKLQLHLALILVLQFLVLLLDLADFFLTAADYSFDLRLYALQSVLHYLLVFLTLPFFSLFLLLLHPNLFLLAEILCKVLFHFLLLLLKGFSLFEILAALLK